MLLFCSLLWASTVAWLLARACRQYRAYTQLSASPNWLPDQAPSVTVIVPARNEEGNITRCLTGLLQQDYPNERFEVVVVDDNSSDRTAEVVCGFVAFDERVRLIPSGALPAGWAGKPHACWQGAFTAEGEWLCFMDADVVAEPGLLRGAVSEAEANGIDMLSLEPFQKLETFWERVVIPAGLFLLAFTKDLRKVNDPAAAEATANGQFILIRRQIYQAVGGHSAVHGELCEDSALARLVKRSGRRLLLLSAEHLVSVRMYTGLGSLWEGFSRNAVEIAGGPGAAVFFSLSALALGWAAVFVPAVALVQMLRGPFEWLSLTAFAFSSAGSLAVLAVHLGATRYFRIPFWHGLLFPLGYTVAALISLNSVRERLRGKIPWKGRIYGAPAGEATVLGK